MTTTDEAPENAHTGQDVMDALIGLGASEYDAYGLVMRDRKIIDPGLDKKPARDIAEELMEHYGIEPVLKSLITAIDIEALLAPIPNQNETYTKHFIPVLNGEDSGTLTVVEPTLSRSGMLIPGRVAWVKQDSKQENPLFQIMPVVEDGVLMAGRWNFVEYFKSRSLREMLRWFSVTGLAVRETGAKEASMPPGERR